MSLAPLFVPGGNKGEPERFSISLAGSREWTEWFYNR